MDFIIFITDNTLLYYKPLVGDIVAKIVIPTERSDEGSLKLNMKEISPHCNRMPGGIQCIPYYIIILTINIYYEKIFFAYACCPCNAAWQLCTAKAYI